MTQWEALGLTLALELPVALGIAWFCGLRDEMARVAMVAAAASLLTHPFAWYFAVDGLAHWPYWPRAILIESAVVAAETVIYTKVLGVRWRLGAMLSLAANAFSFLAGLGLARFL